MISLIAAIGKNNELGKNNKLIWDIPSDLVFFKEKTVNHKIIMGYNTYISIGRPLPKRTNIVLVDDPSKIEDKTNLIVYSNIEDLYNIELSTNEEVFIIGGSSLYNYFYPIADKMYLTLIDEIDDDADVYFPTIIDSDWNKTILDSKNENNINYKHVLYERCK